MGGIVRNGFAELLRSQVKMKPLACPAAIVEWSADIAKADTGPHSAAMQVSAADVTRLVRVTDLVYLDQQCA